MPLLNEIPLPQLPPRRLDAHKGDFGRAALIGGSRGMAGAIGLAGMATLRSGAGLVTLAVPQDIQSTVAAFEPSYMTWALASDAQGRLDVLALQQLAPLLERATCVAIGPGLNRSPGIDQLVTTLYATLPLPMVIDADGLNVLADSGIGQAAGPRILTPHPGEMRRLCADAQGDRQHQEQVARQFAGDHGVVVVLKGEHTLITDGKRSAHNTTGNPGMATGGTGDVLTGIITGLLAQGLVATDAARLGVYVHGLAGDLARADLGEVAMIASDVLRHLPPAFRELAGQKEEAT